TSVLPQRRPQLRSRAAYRVAWRRGALLPASHPPRVGEAHWERTCRVSLKNRRRHCRPRGWATVHPRGQRRLCGVLREPCVPREFFLRSFKTVVSIDHRSTPPNGFERLVPRGLGEGRVLPHRCARLDIRNRLRAERVRNEYSVVIA